MLPKRVLQEVLDDLKRITRVDLCVLEGGGRPVAGSLECGERLMEQVREFMAAEAESQTVRTDHLFKIYFDGEIRYVLAVRGDQDAFMVGKIAVSQITHLLRAYHERTDKNKFMQDVLFNNMLLTDMRRKAEKLKISLRAARAVYIIETKEDQDSLALQTLQNMFRGEQKDIITAVSERRIVLVKETGENTAAGDLEATARLIADMINTEAMIPVRVSCGTVVYELEQVSRSYQEAVLAIDIGRIFYSPRTVISYQTLGVGRLIYQLPVPLCRQFLEEIFGERIPDELDEETMATAYRFFENNLNISETARQLYVHRNTLMYRLEKIEKSTGLDIRGFEDALTLRIALMVAGFLKYQESRDCPG